MYALQSSLHITILNKKYHDKVGDMKILSTFIGEKLSLKAYFNN